MGEFLEPRVKEYVTRVWHFAQEMFAIIDGGIVDDEALEQCVACCKFAFSHPISRFTRLPVV